MVQTKDTSHIQTMPVNATPAPPPFSAYATTARFLTCKQDNPAREPLTVKCVRVIVENFERLPAHDATGGLEVSDENRSSDRAEPDAGGGAVTTGGDALGTGGGNVVRGIGGDGGESSGLGESKAVEEGEGPQGQQQQQQREARTIPAKFLQSINAGLSTNLDPKVRGTDLVRVISFCFFFNRVLFCLLEHKLVAWKTCFDGGSRKYY